MLGDVDHAAGNPSQKHSLDHDLDHDSDHDHKPNKSLLNTESRKMTTAGENILRRGGRKTMEVAELRSSDEVGRGAGDLEFVIDVTQTEPRSMSLQVIIYPLFPPAFGLFKYFVFDLCYHSEPAHFNSGYAAPVRKGETPSSLFLFSISYHHYIVYHTQSYSSEGKKINWPKPEFPGDWSFRRAQEAQLFEGNQ